MDSEEGEEVTVVGVEASRAVEEAVIVDSPEAAEGEVDEVDSSEVETLVLRILFWVSRGYWLEGYDVLNLSDIRDGILPARRRIRNALLVSDADQGSLLQRSDLPPEQDPDRQGRRNLGPDQRGLLYRQDERGYARLEFQEG